MAAIDSLLALIEAQKATGIVLRAREPPVLIGSQGRGLTMPPLDAGMLDYLNGMNFEPQKELTRAEAAEILSKTPWGKDQIKKLLSGA